MARRAAGKRTLRLKRVYDEPKRTDGCRVLVDRLWPRGLSKEAAAVDLWLKEVAPSDGLRKWFGHQPQRWAAFKRKYAAELRDRGELVEQLFATCGRKTVTLLYAAKDTEHNNAVALKEFLEA